MPESKVFFVYSYHTPYISQDIVILRKHFKIILGDFTDYPRDFKSFFRMVREIYRGIKKSEITLVWFADFRAFLSVFISLFLRKKVIVLVGGYEVTSLRKYKYGGLRNPLSKFKVKYILKHATQIIAVSNFSLQEIIKITQEERVELIPLGVPVEQKNLDSPSQIL